SGHEADRAGALHLVASTPLGKAALWLLVVGFAGMCLWRASPAIWGSPRGGGEKGAKPAGAAAPAGFFRAVPLGLLKSALGLGAPSSSDSQSKDLTATALHYPGGQVLVVIAGLVFAGAGGYLAWRAFKKKFRKHLDMGSASPAVRRAVERIGQVGGI